MKLEVTEKVEIPEGIEVSINRDTVVMKLNDREHKKRFDIANITLVSENKEIIIESKKATRRENKMIKTIKAHIVNMVKGLQEDFEYKLEAVFVHFPMTIEMNKDDKTITVKNFFGGKKPIHCNILDGTEVEINKSKISVKSYDIELAGQMAANLEKMTKLKGKDRRKFQDGIYIVEKPGRVI